MPRSRSAGRSRRITASCWKACPASPACDELGTKRISATSRSWCSDAYPLGRDGLYQKLRDAGIHARRYFYPLISEFPMYQGIPSAAPANLPRAAAAARQVLCLPIYPALEARDIERIASLIKSS
jgi:dTDP-4-amino-4,6-dideoxygalactose transaminase